jgi:hypothetical protein
VIKAGVGLPAVGIMASRNNTIVNGIPHRRRLAKVAEPGNHPSAGKCHSECLPASVPASDVDEPGPTHPAPARRARQLVRPNNDHRPSLLRDEEVAGCHPTNDDLAVLARREAALEGRGCLGECVESMATRSWPLSTSFGAMDYSPVLDLFL